MGLFASSSPPDFAQLVARRDIKRLAKLAADKDPQVRCQAVVALGDTEDERAAPQLITSMRRDPIGDVRWRAARALGRVRSAMAISDLIDTLNHDEDGFARKYAALALGKMRVPDAVPPLKRAIREDFDRRVCEACVEALGMIGTVDAKKAVNVITKGKDAKLAAVAQQAMLPTIVGESHYQPTLAAIAAATKPDQWGRLLAWAWLSPEPTNPYDSSAVAVKVGHDTVGYLPKVDASRYCEPLQRRSQPYAFWAELRGGGQAYGGGQMSWGIFVLEAPPAPEDIWQEAPQA